MIKRSKALANKYAYVAGNYDVIVVGAGHAGCEAALASARLGKKTALFTIHMDAVANLPCNPSIGGTGKGQLVREIDALGGQIGKMSDDCAIQTRMLNRSKGAAVRSPRAQVDRQKYSARMRYFLERQTNLFLRQAQVTKLVVDDDEKRLIAGVVTQTGAVYLAPAVVLATGTYMEARIIMGEVAYESGPDGQFPSKGLSKSLQALGLPIRRFKTGTPVRVNRNSIDFDRLERQDGESDCAPFSFINEMKGTRLPARQEPCYVLWTTPETRDIIKNNLSRSPLFSGDITGTGPRYCPSIEDKFVKFPDKERHQIFVEPMGENTLEMYLQGFSTSLPEQVQEAMVQSLPGMAKAHIQRSAYAIEYDCVDPTTLRLSLATKDITGLYMAGQINGSSGYEEAAAQGLMAGINAARWLDKKEPLILDRSQAYIGVLIDDLVTKGTMEPYRMMTSRAEYRLCLRQDNADARLTKIGRQIGLVDDEQYTLFINKQQKIKAEWDRLHQTIISPCELLNQRLKELDTAPVSSGILLADLLRRPQVSYAALAEFDTDRPCLSPDVLATLEVDLKYEGYIKLERQRIEKFRQLEHKELPSDIDYDKISGLRIEARQKLSAQRPLHLGQASRISGVSPADMAVLLIYLESRRRTKGANK